MDTREFKGLELAARSRIECHKSYWSVPSATSGGSYAVSREATTCTCEDFELRKLPCKHIFAVRFVLERDGDKPLLVKPDAEQPPPKKTYRTDWANYNAAQTNEKRLFLELLADLCTTVPTPPQQSGRPRLPLCDAVFAAAFKVYSTLSGRRFTCDLREAEAKGYIRKAPHYNSVLRVLEDEEVTPILHQLIQQSSAPLRLVESQFACDSSGFSTCRFLRWFDQKYGVTRKKAKWVKAHLMCGTKTNVVTAVILTDGADCPQLPALADATAKTFQMQEVSADKGYSSHHNLEYLHSLGAVPYIAFKNNTRAGTSPTVWQRMYCEFTLNREDWLAHYHRRSNVESTFSMIKAKFGDSVRSKSDTATKNEVLAKILCHNLCRLVHAIYELGIDPKLREVGAEPTALNYQPVG